MNAIEIARKLAALGSAAEACQAYSLVLHEGGDPAGELEAVLVLIGRFAEKRRAVLSLNENEALVTARAIRLEAGDLAGVGEALRKRFGITEVLIHTLRESLLCTPRGVSRKDTRFIPEPKISTGAGDHFNAAASWAQCWGFRMKRG